SFMPPYINASTRSVVTWRTVRQRAFKNSDDSARLVLLLLTIFVVLLLSIFPLIVSLMLSFARVTFIRGGINIQYVGASNYDKLLFGSQRRHLIGRMDSPTVIGWVVLAAFTGFMLWWLYTS